MSELLPFQEKLLKFFYVMKMNDLQARIIVNRLHQHSRLEREFTTMMKIYNRSIDRSNNHGLNEEYFQGVFIGAYYMICEEDWK